MPERSRGGEVSLTNKPGHRISDLEFQALPKSRSSMVLMTIVNESVSAKMKKDSDIRHMMHITFCYHMDPSMIQL